MTRFSCALIAMACAGIAAPAAAQQAPRTIIGVDISGSSTFLFDQTSADAMGEFVEKYIARLDAPHAIDVISVGDEGLGHRAIDLSAAVGKSRASSAKRLAPQFAGYLRSLPSRAARGELKAQGTTSLISFLHSLEGVCKAGNATAVVFSDGIEWSAAIDGRALAAGKAKLPAPKSAFLKGCTVSLLGVGQLRASMDSGGLAERLVPQWREFLSAAGAEPVTVTGSGFTF